MSDNVLEVTDVSKSFPGVVALDSVSLAVRAGEVHALLGENGAGKSTLIKIVSGAQAPDSGQVSIAGSTMAHPSPAAAQALGVRVIHQERQIAPDMSVAENVLLDRIPTNRLGLVGRHRVETAAGRQLRMLGIDLPAAAAVRTLTVAQQQLVELARAVSFDARLVIMDEPTASLHREEVQTLFGIVRRLRERGVAVLYISHHLDEVFAIAERVTVLRDGRVAGARDVATTTPDELIALIFGKDVDVTRESVRAAVAPEGVRAGGRTAPDGPPEVVVAARDLCYRNAVRGVSVEVRTGEIVGLTGAQGSGASELAQLLAGALAPTGGTIVHGPDGRRLGSRTDHTRHGVAFLPADRKRHGLLMDNTVAENILLSRLSQPREFVTRFRRNHRRATSVARRLSIKTRGVAAPVRALSGGNQQKSILGRWLDVDSKLFVFDEPTSGVDISSKVELYHRLLDAAAAGAAVVFVSADYEEIMALADRVIVMRDGRVVGEVSGDDAGADRLVHIEIGA